MKKYNKTKQTPSAESVRRVKKEYRHLEVISHPYFKDEALSKAETDVLAGLKNWRPNATIFELNIGSKNEGAQVMKAKRKLHQRAIEKKKKAAVERAEQSDDDEEMPSEKPEVESADENDVVSTTLPFNHFFSVAGERLLGSDHQPQVRSRRRIGRELQSEEEAAAGGGTRA